MWNFKGGWKYSRHVEYEPKIVSNSVGLCVFSHCPGTIMAPSNEAAGTRAEFLMCWCGGGGRRLSMSPRRARCRRWGWDEFHILFTHSLRLLHLLSIINKIWRAAAACHNTMRSSRKRSRRISLMLLLYTAPQRTPCSNNKRPLMLHVYACWWYWASSMSINFPPVSLVLFVGASAFFFAAI